MKMVDIVCAHCGETFAKPAKEYTRQMKNHAGEAKFYCGKDCLGIATTRRQLVHRAVDATCAGCGEVFASYKGAKYCGRSCASRHSVTPHRRESARQTYRRNKSCLSNISVIAAGLRARERHKYEEVERLLVERGIVHQFEFPVEVCNRVFDLAIPEKRLLIEFDEKHHDSSRQALDDRMKDADAGNEGWRIHRVQVHGHKPPYPAHLISGLL